MEYVFDFMRLRGGDRSAAKRRGGAGRRPAPGVLLKRRLVFYGLLLGLMIPVIRQIDGSMLVPRGSRIEWPRGFGVAWPAGPLRLLGGRGWGWGGSAVKAEADAGAASTVAAAAMLSGRKTVSARFTICGHGKRIDCMVDGDTVWMAGTKIRIADIDTPETHPPRCTREARLGRAATVKMQALLNAGPFTLVPIKRDVDRYGRKLRLVERDGVSLGAVLVGEGLARSYGGGKRAGWC